MELKIAHRGLDGGSGSAVGVLRVEHDEFGANDDVGGASRRGAAECDAAQRAFDRVSLRLARKQIDRPDDFGDFAAFGVQINIMNIPKLFQDVRASVAQGVDLGLATQDAISKYRELNHIIPRG